jgi:hypothetical protein
VGALVVALVGEPVGDDVDVGGDVAH